MAHAQTFELGKGRTFVSGLFWQPLPGATAAARKAEVEKIAEEQNFDLAIMRTTGTPQVGFGALADGVRPGMLSAAAMISKTMEMDGADRNFLCATEVPGGKWLYVAQREGVLLHDGDLLGEEDEIRSRMLTDMSLSDWSTIYAPGHWGISGSVERPFADFFPKKGGRLDYKKWWGIKPVKRGLGDIAKAFGPLIVVALILVGGAYGYSRWQQYKAQQEMARIAAEQAAAASQNAAQHKPEHPWKKMMRAQKSWGACNEAIRSVKSLWPGNWTLKDIACDNSVMTVAWVRQDAGWIEHLLAVEPKAVVARDGMSASLIVPMTSGDGEDDPLPKEMDRTLAMYEGAQRYGFKVILSAPTAPPILPGDKPNQPPVAIDWKELAWRVDGVGLDPSIILAALDGNGFRVQKIRAVWSAGVMNWNMEGTQYVSP